MLLYLESLYDLDIFLPTIFTYFVPILYELPILGYQAASKWLWTVYFSSRFFGQGIITGPVIPLHMLLGAIVGWAILSPYAKYRGWASGDVDDWATGSREWIIWVSLAALLADASVKLPWFLLRPLWRGSVASGGIQKHLTAFRKNIVRNHGTRLLESQYLAVSVEIHEDSEANQTHHTQWIVWSLNRHSRLQEERKKSSEAITSRVLGLSFLVSIIICTLAIQYNFGNFFSW